MFDIDDVLLELSYRVESGIVDLTKPEQIELLKEIIRASDTSIHIDSETLQKSSVIFQYLMEAGKKKSNSDKKKIKSQAEKLKLVGKGGTGWGPKGSDKVTHISKDGKLVKLNGPEKSGEKGKDKKSSADNQSVFTGGGAPVFPQDVKKTDDSNKSINFSESAPEEIYNYMGVMDDSGKKILKPKKINDRQFFTELEKSRKNAFAGEKAGKGGPATTFQEEMSCLITEITQKNPELSREDVVKSAVKILSKSKFAKDNQLSDDYLYSLGMKSSAGVEIAREMQKNPVYNLGKKQPKGYPKSFALSTLATQNCIHFLTSKLEEAKKSNDKKAIEHYDRELKYFAELATKATGKEGDADTVLMYIDKNGRTRFLYITNKQTHSDPKLNHTKKSRANYIIANEVEGSNIRQLISISNIAAGKTKNMNKQATSSMKKIKSEPKFKKAIAAIPGAIADAVFGRDSYKATDEYKKDALKNPLVREYLKKNKLRPTNQNIIKACINVVGEEGAEQIADTSNGTPGKLLMKMGNVWKEIDSKIRSGKTYKEIAEQSKGKNKLFGGKLSAKQIEEIHKNPVLAKLSKIESARGDSMRAIQEEIVTEIIKEDEDFYKQQGMKRPEIVKKLDSENGPNGQTYVKTFMSGMHWSRAILGTHDGRMASSIGSSLTKSEYYRECLAALTDYTGEIESEEGRKKFYEYLIKKIKIRPGDDSVIFTNRKGEVKKLGYDTWRTAGGGEKITGTDGEDLIKCLQSKEAKK